MVRWPADCSAPRSDRSPLTASTTQERGADQLVDDLSGRIHWRADPSPSSRSPVRIQPRSAAPVTPVRWKPRAAARDDCLRKVDRHPLASVVTGPARVAPSLSCGLGCACPLGGREARPGQLHKARLGLSRCRASAASNSCLVSPPWGCRPPCVMHGALPAPDANQCVNY
jgi:hypothetical protein